MKIFISSSRFARINLNLDCFTLDFNSKSFLQSRVDKYIFMSFMERIFLRKTVYEKLFKSNLFYSINCTVKANRRSKMKYKSGCNTPPTTSI